MRTEVSAAMQTAGGRAVEKMKLGAKERTASQIAAEAAI